MTSAEALSHDLPHRLAGLRVPFTDDEVVIEHVTLAAGPSPGDVVVLVDHRGARSGPGRFSFVIDDSWGFGDVQDVVDQLVVDLVEHLDTEA